MRRRVIWTLAIPCAVFGVRALGSTGPSPSFDRGLTRFACGCEGLDRSKLIPECVRAPAPDSPWAAPAPIGVLDESLSAADPVAACFDPDFPPSLEVQDALERAMRGAMLDRFVQRVRWNGSNNAPISLSWSFVPDGTLIPAAAGIGDLDAPSELFARMDEKFGGDRALWIAQFESIFARWAELVGVSYQRVTFNANPWDDGAAWGSSALTGRRGDIRIGMKPIDGGFGILAYNGYPTSSDMVLDSAENWGGSANSYRLLRNTLSHEHGHGLGLAHVCPRNNTKLMEPFLSTLFDGPQEDEIRALQNYYGDPYEPNGTASTTSATPLGVLPVGGVLSPSVIPSPPVANAALTSIGINDEVDHYFFTVAAPMVVTITLTPVGSFYADYVQDATCNNTTPVTDALRQADLVLDLLSSSGTSIRSASSTGFGAAETIPSFLLSPAVNYFVRVKENSAPVEPQLYNLSISGIAEPFTASDGAFADRVRLNWGAITAATSYTIYRGTSTNRASATVLAQPSSTTVQFDDTTAVLGQTYFYWLEAATMNIAGSRPAAGPESGFRAIAPTNDSCASPLSITTGASVGFNTSTATTDGPAETACGAAQIAADLWYLYTPQSTGPFTVRTCGSTFDTRLAVYASAGCPAAGAALACNDNAATCPGGSGVESTLRINGVSGQPYRVRVGGAPGAVGAGQVQVFCPGDFNLSGSITIQDVFDFLAAYFASGPGADFNGSGAITVQDVFDLLAAYFDAC